MLTLLNIADMVADILKLDDVYAGIIDSNKEKAIGIYNDKNASVAHNICLGGNETTKTKEKNISILIHWTDIPTLAEMEADVVLVTLSNVRNYSIDNKTIIYVKCNEPKSVGKDGRGINEYVLECKIYYEERKK